MNLDRPTIKKLLFLILASIVIFLALQRVDAVIQFLGFCFQLLSPLVIGACIAFILNALLKLWENRIFGRLKRSDHKFWKKYQRAVCLFLTYGTVVGFLLLLVFLIVPQISKSFGKLIDQIPTYVESIQQWTDQLSQILPISQDQIQEWYMDWDQIMENMQAFLQNWSPSLFDTTMDITSALFHGVFNFIMGLAFSVYMLAQKEKLCRQAKKIVLAFLPREKGEYIISVGKLSNVIFGKFVTGQLLEAFIIGILCFLGMSIGSMPYAALISTIVGCTALIPIFGAFFGTAVGAFLLLMDNPMTAVGFVFFIIVLQQVEGNLIYPRVVGNSVGLPGIWVLFTVLVGGSVFGIFGMLIGIPIASVAYCLLKSAVARRLQKQELSEDEIETIGTLPEQMLPHQTQKKLSKDSEESQ